MFYLVQKCNEMSETSIKQNDTKQLIADIVYSLFTIDVVFTLDWLTVMLLRYEVLYLFFDGNSKLQFTKHLKGDTSRLSYSS